MKEVCDPLVNVVSSLSGSISFCVWLVAQLPQLIETYQNKTVDGISPYFFLIWLVGDITSFVGCILTKQLYFQYVIALYFLLNDVILCGQYYYYGYYYHHKHRRHSRRQSSYGSIRAALPAAIIAANIVPTEALPIEIVHTESINLGVLCSWVGACCYFFARVPQLLKNYNRKSVADLSPFLFVCTLIGNLTYGTSILISCEFIYDDKKWDFFMNELPFLIGSAGTIIFDIVYFYQVYIYRETKEQEPLL